LDITDHGWLRLYMRLMDNEDVHALTDSEFRTWIFCLLATKANGGFLPPNKTIAFKLRRKQQVVADHIAAILDAGLLVCVANELQPTGWNKFQFQSDVSTDRVKRFRNGKRNGDETFPKRPQSTEYRVQSKTTPPQRATRDETAYPAPADGPDPQELVAAAVEACAQVWPNIGDKRYARSAWEREAAVAAGGVQGWCVAIVATAQSHGPAHIAAKESDRRHFIPTLDKWVSCGDYSSPPPKVIRAYIGPIDLGEDFGLGGKKNGV